MLSREILLRYKTSVLIFLSITLIALGTILSGAFSTKKTVIEHPPVVRSVTIKMSGFEQSAKYAGEVRGRYESQLAFQVSGKIIRRNIELGSQVSAGSVLMEIDPKDVQQTVNISAAQVLSAQSQLKLAENNLHRYQALFAQGAVSRVVLEQYENAYAAALAASRMASAQNSQGTNQLDYTALRATTSGVISAINVEAGQVVSAGQAVVTLVQDGEREVEIDVPENRYEEILTAKEIKVSFWALPDRIIEGKVREISPMADKTSRTYKVRIQLTNPPAELKLGMTASVSTAGAAANSSNSLAVIPLSAIYQTGNTPSVWVVSAGVVSLRPVKLGNFGDSSVQVLSGLKDQDIIVTAGVHKLKEGQKVRLAGESN
jgi:RND family efflux transporter MFP subunit